MPLAPVIVKPANAGTELSKSTSASAISWLIVLANLRLINHKPSSQSDKTVTCFLAIGEKRKPRQRADSIQAAYLVLLRSPCNFVLVSKANFSSLPVRETSFGFALQARRLALFAKGRAKSRTAPLPQPGCRALLARASRDSECPRGTDRPAKFSALNPSRA